MAVTLRLILVFLATTAFTASAQEIAYLCSESGWQPLDSGNITEYNGSEIVNFAISASTPGTKPCASNRSLESIKEEIRRKVDRGNDLVRDHGLNLISNISSQIYQICAIYDYVVDARNWTYVNDWTCLENFQYANYTLKKGQEVGGLGKGDCDDFAILLASLVESIGGYPRIIFAYGPLGGHAYTEVFLGKDFGDNQDEDSDVDCMLRD